MDTKHNANLIRLRKIGEVVDLAGRALAAAGLGGEIVAKIALGKAPTFHPGALIMAAVGVVMVGFGIDWQARAHEDAKEDSDVD